VFAQQWSAWAATPWKTWRNPLRAYFREGAPKFRMIDLKKRATQFPVLIQYIFFGSTQGRPRKTLALSVLPESVVEHGATDESRKRVSNCRTKVFAQYELFIVESGIQVSTRNARIFHYFQDTSSGFRAS
jgi:hypothetical protein